MSKYFKNYGIIIFKHKEFKLSILKSSYNTLMPKHLLMCPPTYFDVEYEINAWMSLENRVDSSLAEQQWQRIKDVYEQLGHKVDLIEPVAGLPDMVFTANGGMVIGGKALAATFKYPQRQPETARFENWFRAAGYDTALPKHIWEGEGDCRLVGQTLFAAYGSRSQLAAHGELANFFGLKVIGLELVNPYFYHLDTCFCPLDDETFMYFPGAFSDDSLTKIRASDFKLIQVSAKDAEAFGINAFSDGHNVVLCDQAEELANQISRQGFNPILVDISEFKKSGGGVKCITLELRP